ncbi:MAG: hypothetical protein KF871_10865 [Hydrogenophaga sp.]|uniref:hypothetical protein n=1 Tax=Hydrogenophaga sp. TaxID=1904254 RepID=UPI001DE6D8FA|nr:hypothetical protein [Hydrogenophaga sp.]MBX3610383.1 hypothetical protein [Hydrogenophaga sp.]
MLVFLSAMSDGATIGEAAHEAGVDRTTVYRWKEADAEFAAAWDDSLEEGTERLEREAMRRAVVGVEEPVIYQGQLTPVWEMNPDGTPKMVEVEEVGDSGMPVKVRKPVQARNPDGSLKYLTVNRPSDTLMIFLLKARRPNTYRERGAVELSGPGGKPLAPVAAAAGGVLVVPGMMADPAAWADAVKKATPE